MNNYELKKQARIEKYQYLAKKAEQKSQEEYKEFKKLSEPIPWGQPILVGHHSEKGHRKLLDRIDSKMRNSIKEFEKAEYYEQKAKSVVNNYAISSDDPEALVKLKRKLQNLEHAHETYKKTNAIIRKYKTDKERAKNLEGVLSSDLIPQILKPDYMGRIGFASYVLTNNKANIARIQKRIRILEKRKNAVSSEVIVNDVKIIDNIEANRIQLFFNGIPEKELRTQLKQNGFRWTPSQQCWQAYRSSYKLNQIKNILSN